MSSFFVCSSDNNAVHVIQYKPDKDLAAQFQGIFIQKEVIVVGQRYTALCFIPGSQTQERTPEEWTALYEEGLIGASLSYGYGVCDTHAYGSISGESKDPEEVYRRIWTYIDEMQKNGVDPIAFERCKRVFYADCVASYDDTSEIAHSLMDMVFDNEELFDEPQAIADVTLADVNALLRKVFAEEKAVMAVVAPISAADADKEENE